MDLVLVGSDCHAKAHCFLGVRLEKEFKVLKVVYEYICSVLDQKVCELKYLSGSQSFPSHKVATRLNYSSDTASRLNFQR